MREHRLRHHVTCGSRVHGGSDSHPCVLYFNDFRERLRNISADFATFQQQLRQEVADVIQQLRAEVDEAISGRMDMLNSINTALQNVWAKSSLVFPRRSHSRSPWFP